MTVTFNIYNCDHEPNNIDENPLPVNESVKFSTNLPLSLDSFTCAPIYATELLRHLQSDLPVNVKIFEFREIVSDGNQSGNLLLEMETGLRSQHRTVFLPQPILIRPGLLYMIEIGPFQDHFVNLDGLKKRVVLDSGAII